MFFQYFYRSETELQFIFHLMERVCRINITYSGRHKTCHPNFYKYVFSFFEKTLKIEFRIFLKLQLQNKQTFRTVDFIEVHHLTDIKWRKMKLLEVTSSEF